MAVERIEQFTPNLPPHNLEAEQSVLGAILWTGYLGGAVATHVRFGRISLSITPQKSAAFVMWSGGISRSNSGASAA